MLNAFYSRKASSSGLIAIMPLTQGKLHPDDERRIKKNIRDLKRDMDAKDLIDYFIEKEIFDFADLEKINGYNPNTSDNRNNCFFILLLQSGPQAYSVFLDSLRVNGQDHLADLVENTQLEGSAVAAEKGIIQYLV